MADQFPLVKDGVVVGVGTRHPDEDGWEARFDNKDRKLVNCDDETCSALDTPQTLEETMTAIEHWRKHSWLSGCSHGE